MRKGAVVYPLAALYTSIYHQFASCSTCPDVPFSRHFSPSVICEPMWHTLAQATLTTVRTWGEARCHLGLQRPAQMVSPGPGRSV